MSSGAVDLAIGVVVKAAFWIPLVFCATVAFTANPTDFTASLSGAVAHAAAFAYLAIALFAAHFRTGRWGLGPDAAPHGEAFGGATLAVVLWMLAFGVMIEVGQTFVDGRSGEIFDVIVDATGIAAGCVAYRAWAWRAARRARL